MKAISFFTACKIVRGKLEAAREEAERRKYYGISGVDYTKDKVNHGGISDPTYKTASHNFTAEERAAAIQNKYEKLSAMREYLLSRIEERGEKEEEAAYILRDLYALEEPKSEQEICREYGYSAEAYYELYSIGITAADEELKKLMAK